MKTFVAKVCRNCARSYTPTSASQLYCASEECRRAKARTYSARYRASDAALAAKRKYEADPERIYNQRRSCVICGVEFTPRTKIHTSCGARACSRARSAESTRAWKNRPENREKERAYNKKRSADPAVKERLRYNALEWKYGLTRAAFDAMLIEQGHRCAVCRSADPGRWWCVDHDHSCCSGRGKTCGKCVRGILCENCNMIEGLLCKAINKSSGAEADLVLDQLLARMGTYMKGTS